ncbi:MAG: hypothetical protein QXL82_00305 [Candidatus Aenigmatarchaeota archaeon]
MRNIINIFIASLFCGISFGYIFSLNFLNSFLLAFGMLFISFLVSYWYSEKSYIKPVFDLFIPGMIISLLLIFFKLPIFPILSIADVYYYAKARKIFERKISSLEIGKIAKIFLLILFLFNIFGILIKNFYISFLSSLLILSFLIPYKNSFGSILFFYDIQFFAIILISSLIFLFISFSFMF